ncbi:MAG: anti-sigma-factor antagonist [Blastococcus sp.]|nr:anti-sigma-factor antagonist [Blastococcus sp.]
MTAISLEQPNGLVTVDVSGPPEDVRLTVTGEVDSSSAPLLRQHLDTVLDGQVAGITIDLGGVTFLDSAGLCVLAAAHRRSVAQQVRLRVLASSRAVIRPLQITGLWALLRVEHVEPPQADPTPARKEDSVA